MKKSFIVSVFLLFALFSCRNPSKHAVHDLGKIPLDSSLRNLAQASNKQIISAVPTITVNKDLKWNSIDAQALVDFDARFENQIASKISGRIDKLYLRYNQQKVTKGQLLMEIYSPELAAAQQELIYMAEKDNKGMLFAQAQAKLQLMGMSYESIMQALKTKKVSYSVPIYSSYDGFVVENNADINPTNSLAIKEGQYVNAGETIFQIYQSKQMIATIALNPSVASKIEKQNKVLLYALNQSEPILKKASIALMEPQIKENELFIKAKIYLDAKDNYKIGELLGVKIPLVSAGFWIPQTAVYQLGNRSIVFRKVNNVFRTQSVEIGSKIENYIQVKTDIGQWEIAKNAAYLIDSESIIN